MPTIINDVAYSWAMIELTSPTLTGTTTANSVLLQGCQAIKWNKKWNVKTNYGLGGRPVNRGFGNWEYTASITLDYNTQVMLRNMRGSLTNIGEFDLIISFANEFNTDNWTEETVTLKGCLFNEDGMDAKQDDTSLTKEFDLNPFNIIVSGDESGA